MIIIQGFAFEMQHGMNEFDHCIFWRCLSSGEKGLKNSGLNRDLNPDLCDAGAVLYQLSYQANWEHVVMWVNYKPVDVEIEDDNNISIASG